MAFAHYFDRAAVGAAQVVSGFREDAFRRLLEERTVGVAVDADAAGAEGHALVDLLVRLFARLYPRLAIVGDGADELRALALRINPRLDLATKADIGVVVGAVETPFATPVYAGSNGWIARVSTARPQTVGDSPLAFGAGASACLAAANVFRRLFVDADGADQEAAVFSTYSGDADDAAGSLVAAPIDLTLVGLGAVGHGAVWALARTPLEGKIRLVDHDRIELSNLQRYVLADLDDVDVEKTAVAARAFASSSLAVEEHACRFASFLAARTERRAAVAAALDSARDRRQVQASLPSVVFNAWTQPGDLGVSVHGRFGGEGACLACLYLPTDQQPNEDQIVAQALGVPERQQQVRLLLADGMPAPPDLLEAIAHALGIERNIVAAWDSVPLRDLYTRGLCGGELVPLERLGAPRADVHVPLAHQSALAGVVLAAQLARFGTDAPPELTDIVRLNVMRPLGVALRQKHGADTTGRCICRDADYVAVYDTQYGRTPTRAVAYRANA